MAGDFFAAVPPPGGRKNSFLFKFRDGHAVDGDGFGGALSFIHAGLGDGDIGRLHPVAEGASGGYLRFPSGL